MTEQTVTLDPRVADFALAVRARLADLSPEVREELAGDLEADLADLVAERGPEALGDPAAYAVELRAAAGLPAPAPRTKEVGPRVEPLLDAAHARWDGFATGLPGRPWELLVALRPVWWVFRAWLALSLVDWCFGGPQVNGSGLAVVPSLLGWGAPLLAVAVVGSVLVGVGRLWPGRGGSVGRSVLLALNLLALAVTPLLVSEVTTADEVVEQLGIDDGTAVPDGVYADGREVGNLFPYDAQGRPLTGVQLLDQGGRPVELSDYFFDESTGLGTYLTGWATGTSQPRSTFPLAVREQDRETGEPSGEPTLPEPPVASLGPVSLDGVTPSRLVTRDRD